MGFKKQQVDGKWRCGCCKKWKQPKDFYEDKRKLNGFSGNCKECWQFKAKIWKLNNLEEDKKLRNKFNQDNPKYYEMYYKNNSKKNKTDWKRMVPK